VLCPRVGQSFATIRPIESDGVDFVAAAHVSTRGVDGFRWCRAALAQP
jgi:hypothetical protein